MHVMTCHVFIQHKLLLFVNLSSCRGIISFVEEEQSFLEAQMTFTGK